MLDLFYQGGALFMSILTIILIAMIAVSVINGMALRNGKFATVELATRKLSYTKSIGLFALVIGVLGQLIGLFSAFQAIELSEGGIGPEMLAGGFKISMITTLYGLIIYALSLLIWLSMSTSVEKRFDQ